MGKLRDWLRQWDADELNFTEDTFAPTPKGAPQQVPDGDWSKKTIARLEQRQMRTFQRFYPIAAALLCTVIIFFLLLTVSALPSFGREAMPANNLVTRRYIEDGLEETGAVNVVAGVILDYRAFDTLGESHVLYTATTAVLMLMLSFQSAVEPKKLASITQGDPILRQTARIIVPMAMLYGIYVMFNGHLGPGGGFAGGAVVGGALILYAIAFGFENLDKLLNLKSYRVIVLCALSFYSLAKCYSFFCGANGLETIFTTGTPGAIFSAGLILPLNLAVGVVVACTMYGFFSLFTRGRI